MPSPEMEGQSTLVYLVIVEHTQISQLFRDNYAGLRSQEQHLLEHISVSVLFIMQKSIFHASAIMLITASDMQ